jgi:hypothetical protein
MCVVRTSLIGTVHQILVGRSIQEEVTGPRVYVMCRSSYKALVGNLG